VDCMLARVPVGHVLMWTGVVVGCVPLWTAIAGVAVGCVPMWTAIAGSEQC